MACRRPLVLIYHPTDTREYCRLSAEALPGANLVPCCSIADVEALIPDAEIVFGWRLPARALARAAQLRWFQSTGAGVEDLVAVLPPQTVLTRVVGIFGPWIAEYVIAHLLAWTQNLKRAYASQAARKWDRYLVRKARGMRLGVCGLGLVGSEVARLAHAAGFEVSGYDLFQRALPDGSPAYAGQVPADEPRRPDVLQLAAKLQRGNPLRQFLSGLDALSVNLPLTPQTERLFGAAEFAALPLGAFVVNTSRGKVLDQAALVEALQSGHLGGAALDVFVEEPLPAESPLWTMPNVTVTAHLSGPSTPEEVVPQFVANYRRYLAGEAMTGLVDRLKGF